MTASAVLVSVVRRKKGMNSDFYDLDIDRVHRPYARRRPQAGERRHDDRASHSSVKPAPSYLVHARAHLVVGIGELARIPELVDHRPVFGRDGVRLARQRTARSAAGDSRALTLTVSLDAVGPLLIALILSTVLSNPACRPHDPLRTVHGVRRRDRAEQHQKSYQKHGCILL
jgi:hypothetical protein